MTQLKRELRKVKCAALRQGGLSGYEDHVLLIIEWRQNAANSMREVFIAGGERKTLREA